MDMQQHHLWYVLLVLKKWFEDPFLYIHSASEVSEALCSSCVTGSNINASGHLEDTSQML